MATQFKPGSTITISITRTPQRPDDVDTLRRLMRMNRRTQAALDRAREQRHRTLETRQRGGRQWAVREHPGKLVHPVAGASWTLSYRPQIAADLASVAKFISIAT